MPASTRAMVRYSVVNWASTLTYQAPTFAIPVIVLVNVNADENASFYVAWGVAALACYVPTAIGQALLAEGGRDGAHLRTPGAAGDPGRRRADGGRRDRGHARARPDRHALRRRVPGGSRRAPRARLRRHPLGRDLGVPDRGAGPAPQRRHRAHHRGPLVSPSSCRRSCSCPSTASTAPPPRSSLGNLVAAVVALGTHVQGRSTADAPIPAPSPDDFEPEDAVALTPLA